MRIWYTFFLLSTLIVGACGGEGPPPAEDAGPKTIFHTTPPSQLYFKNIRSTSYYSERKKHSEMDIYRLRKFSTTRKRPILYPLIIQNWLEDEAYLFVEPNDYLYNFADKLPIRWLEEGKEQQLTLPYRGKEEELAFAEAIYQALLAGHQLEIKVIDHGWVPLFKDGGDRQHFLITMRDYLRLTERT